MSVGPLAPRRRPDVTGRWAGADLVLYDSRSGRLHILNQTAATVWFMCDGKASESRIAQELGAAFNLGASADPAGDVRKILSSFSAEALLEGSTHVGDAGNGRVTAQGSR